MTIPAALVHVTPVILTYNEEANLGRTLGRLAWARRIVVVDSLSTDRTLAMLGAYPQVDVFRRPFDDHTTQWNYGLAQVETEWVLSLDADYVLSDAFVEEMAAVLEQPAADGYFASFRYCVFGRPLRGSLYPPRLVLFRQGKGTYVPDGHTQLLRLDGASGTLRATIDHDDRKSLSQWFEAQHRYAKLEARKLLAADASDLRLVDRLRLKKMVAPFLSVGYSLFARGLILDGWPGWFYALQRAYAEILLALRLLEHELSNEHATPEEDPYLS